MENVKTYLTAIELTIRLNYSFIENYEFDTHSQDIYLNKKWFLSNFKLNPRLTRYVRNHKEGEIRGPFTSFVKSNPDINNFLDDLKTIGIMTGLSKSYNLRNFNFYVK